MRNGDRNGNFKALSRTGKQAALNNIQTLLDNVPLKVLGSSTGTIMKGEILISTFPTISTDIF